MKLLNHSDADAILAPIGIKIGQWNELTELGSVDHDATVELVAPTDGSALYVLALWLVDWLPEGRWKLVQVDNSTSPTTDEFLVVEQLLMRPSKWDISTQNTFLFEGGNDQQFNQGIDVLVATFMYFALLFQWHVHIVSAGCRRQQRLALQDGRVIFFGAEEALNNANSLAKRVIASPLTLPEWVQQEKE